MSAIYSKSEKTELLQAEILTDVLTPSIIIPGTPVPLADLEIVSDLHKYLIVVSQDCDLLSDFKARELQKITHDYLDHVLLCEAIPYMEFRKLEDGNIYRSWANQKQVDKIQKNEIERFHQLAELPAIQDKYGIGISEKMIVDFKNIISIETEYLYYILRNDYGAKRRASLTPPYKEHFIQRFYRWHSRVALP